MRGNSRCGVLANLPAGTRGSTKWLVNRAMAMTSTYTVQASLAASALHRLFKNDGARGVAAKDKPEGLHDVSECLRRYEQA